jgi:hypothetical protein
METFHAGLARTAVLYSLLVGLWGLFRYFRRQGIDGSFLGAIFVAEILYVFQGLVGLLLVITGNYADLARPSVHILYGVVSVLVLPAIYIYTHGDTARRTLLIYIIGLLFLAVMLYTRGISTGNEKAQPEQSQRPAVQWRLPAPLAGDFTNPILPDFINTVL